MNNLPTADMISATLVELGWKEESKGYRYTKVFDTAVGPKECSIVVGYNELTVSFWPCYSSEGRNILESHILFVTEKDNVMDSKGNFESFKMKMKDYSKSLITFVDLSFARNLYLKHGTRDIQNDLSCYRSGKR